MRLQFDPCAEDFIRHGAQILFDEAPAARLAAVTAADGLGLLAPHSFVEADGAWSRAGGWWQPYL
jgi:hypothetical protein